MIRAHQDAGATVFESRMADGAVAYIDADWIPPCGSGDVPSLVIHADGTLRFADAWEARVPAGVDPLLAAARVLESIAAAAVASATRYAPPGAIHVTGCGVVAARVRQILLELGGAGSDRPAAIVDTTGDASVIVESTIELADLGVLVLAGMPPVSPMAINLYPDVHVRGLRVIGGGPLCLEVQRAATHAAWAALPVLFDAALVELDRRFAPLTRSGWYRLAAARP